MLVSILKRLISPKPRTSRQLPPPADSIALPVARCAGHARSFMQTTSAPANAEAALRLIEVDIVPLLRSCVEYGDIQSALSLEEWAYVNCITRFEYHSHYESSFRALEVPLQMLGTARRETMRQEPQAFNVRGSIAFFVHNLASDMAHVQLLADLIEAFLDGAPEQAHNLRIVGGSPGQISRRLAALSSKYGVALHRIDNTEGPAACHEALDRWARQAEVGQIIFVSIPMGLSYCSARTGSVVGWMSMKFELPNFPAVVRRYSFTSPNRQRRQVNAQLWRCAPPLFAHSPTLDKSISPPDSIAPAFTRFETVLYSINRAEKISDAGFLDVVCDLLTQFPDTCFVWTGRSPIPAIVAHFERRGLMDRQFFAGWVIPDSLLSSGHIFLDTPHLSGTVAARAMCHGIPVISWVEAKSWLNFILPQVLDDTDPRWRREIQSEIEALHAQGVQLECASPEVYFATASRLIQDTKLRTQFGSALKTIGNTYFLDRQRTAHDHFLNMREPGQP